MNNLRLLQAITVLALLVALGAVVFSVTRICSCPMRAVLMSTSAPTSAFSRRVA